MFFVGSKSGEMIVGHSTDEPLPAVRELLSDNSTHAQKHDIELLENFDAASIRTGERQTAARWDFSHSR
jgi:hypothetical protein